MVVSVQAATLTDTQKFGVPFYDHFSTDDTGLAAHWDIALLPDSRIAVAGEGGISIYDGSEWQLFPLEGFETVTNLLPIDNNSLWVSTSGANSCGIVKFIGNQVTFKAIGSESTLENQISSHIRRIIEYEDFVFFFSDFQCFVFDGNSVTSLRLSKKRKLHPFVCNEKVFCHADDSLLVWEGNEFKTFYRSNKILDDTISFGWKEGVDYYFGAKMGILTLNQEQLEIHKYWDQYDIPDILPNKLYDVDGSLLLTSNTGILVIDRRGNKVESFKPRSETDIKWFTRAAIAPETDTFWLVSPYNIFRVESSVYQRVLHRRFGFEFSSLFDARIIDKTLLLATADGLYLSQQKNGQDATMMLKGCVFNILPFNNKAFISTPWDFLLLEPNGSYTQLLDNLSAYNAVFLDDETLAVATDRLCCLFDITGEIPTLKQSFEAFSGAAHSIFDDADGFLWIATDNKELTRHSLSGEKIPDDKFYAVDSITSEILSIQTTLFKKDDQLFAMSDDVLYQWSGSNQFKSLDFNQNHEWEWVRPRNFPQKGPVFLLRKNKYWGGFQLGELRVDSDGSAKWEPTNIGSIAPIGILRRILVTNEPNGDTTISLIGAEGIKILNWDNLRTTSNYTTPPQPELWLKLEDSLYVDTFEFEEQMALELTAHYKAIHQNQRYPVRYRTKLKGLNDTWSEPTTIASRSFPGLKRGHYTFEVQTVDSYGNFSETSSIEFRVFAPWYTSVYAIIAYTLAVVLASMLFIFLRNRAVRAREAELQARVKERTFELEQAKQQAERSDKLKSTFLANMSHEIRTPMNSIIGIMDLISKKQLSDEESDEYFDIVQESGKGLLRLIDDILDLSKIEVGNLKISNEVTNLDEVGQDVYSMFRQMNLDCHQGDVALVYKPDPQISSPVWIDRNRLIQIYTNLLSNAVKFTTKGTITFGYELSSQNKLRLFVNDTGIGIADIHIQEIFDRFFKIESGKDLNEAGSGLGLTITQHLCKLMGGSISVDSEIGKGSSFSVELPYHPEEGLDQDCNSPKPSSKPKVSFEGKHFLVAEDGNMNYKVIATSLRQSKVTLTRAINGEEAIKLFDPEIHDLILLDLKMPKMDGYGVMQGIRSQGFKTPILVQSACAMSEDKEKCLKAGATDYLAKPYRRQQLIDAIAKTLQTAEL